MNDKNKLKAKILVLIPAAFFAITVVSFVIASILEKPTGRGSIYTFFISVAIIGIFLMPLPSLLLSVIGTIFAIKAITEGIAGSRKYLVIGIIEILASVLGVFLAVLMIIGGMSV